jgi:hypothetical protein
MRPVIRGNAPKVYTHWGQARNDLGNQIGWYCSYCEMGVTNMIEVEHIVPRNHGGAPLNWDNFLLSCKYCNTIKLDRNLGTAGYVWPDRDNTDLTYSYDILQVIQPVNNLVQAEATLTINLMGLNRRPGGAVNPTDADTRWIFRLEAWIIAKRSLRNWQSAPSAAMANQIALTAKGHGFYSIWMNVFAGEVMVLDEIRNEFPNTYYVHNAGGARIVRPGGII